MKIKNLPFLLMACSVIFFSCKKETGIPAPAEVNLSTVANADISPESLEGVSVTEHGFLHFESRETYDNILSVIGNYNDAQLDNWEHALNFTSSKTVYANPQQYGTTAEANLNAVSIIDDLLATIIDQKGIIQIGEYVFKAELDNGYMLEMHESQLQAHFGEFTNGVFNAEVMNQFNNEVVAAMDPEDEDVFKLLTTGITGVTASYNPQTQPDKINIFHAKDEGEDVVEHPDDPNTKYRAKFKASYQKAVVYFSLMAELKYQRGINTMWAYSTDIMFERDVNTNLVTFCSFIPKKGSQETPTVPHDTWNTRVTDNKLNWRPYEKSKKLEKYNMDAYFRYVSVPTNQPRIVHVNTYN